IVNTAGQVGETKDFSVSNHLATLKKHAPGLTIDMVLVNNRPPTEDQLARMAEMGVAPTEYDARETLAMGVETVLRDVVNMDNPVRHDPKKVAAAIMDIFTEQHHLRIL
ncbi:MAG: 2-phospho-L-lactate transferase CofD family protein, partial [Planctomycetes bacterium]|nr:2-phospho-L-lactate transferase CofD family protein [Planctomycetota bacterium]